MEREPSKDYGGGGPAMGKLPKITKVAAGSKVSSSTEKPSDVVDRLVKEMYNLASEIKRGHEDDPSRIGADTAMTVSREELDAKLAANQARLETIEVRIESRIAAEISKVENKIDNGFAEQRAINSRIETALAHMATSRGMTATVASGAVGVFVATLAVLSFAGNRFDAGMNFAGSSTRDIEQLRQKQAETDSKLEKLQSNVSEQYLSVSQKLDALLKAAPKQ